MIEANRVYIASKIGPMNKKVQALRKILEQHGYVINYDWTEKVVPKPFEEHLSEATDAAEAMAKAVMQCDILIVLCAPGGVGYHIETGGALVASIILSFITGQKKKQLYVVGEGNDKSVFYFHQSVIRVHTVLSLLPYLRIPSQS